jgi:hypothetical protein
MTSKFNLGAPKPAPDNISIDELLAAATSPQQVVEIMNAYNETPRADEPASEPRAPYVAPPVAVPEPAPVRAEAPLYPSASTPAAGPYWGPNTTWGASPGAGGGRPREAFEARQGREPWQAGPGQTDVPLEAALAGARTPAEVMELMRRTSQQTGLDVVDEHTVT